MLDSACNKMQKRRHANFFIISGAQKICIVVKVHDRVHVESTVIVEEQILGPREAANNEAFSLVTP